MKIITHEDIVACNISPNMCYDWAYHVIKNKNTILLPPKLSMKPEPGTFCTVMPSMTCPDTDEKFGGVKIVTRFPNREPSLDSKLLLMDVDTGRFTALIDCNWITAMRTGAVACISIELFAVKGYKKIAVMGLGNTARSTILVLLSHNPNNYFEIKLLRYKNQELDFINRFKQFTNVEFSFVNTVEDLVQGSEVIISAITYAPTDLCPDYCFDEGVVVVPIHTPGFSNCDLFFDKVFADDTGHVQHFKNFNRFKEYSEVTDVLEKKIAGRTSNKERILVYNVGISAQDVYFAHKIYESIQSDLQDIDLKAPLQKFWV